MSEGQHLLWTDRRGSVAMMFGLAAAVLVGVIGVALDYSRAASVQTSLQRALDGVALLAAKNNQQIGAAGLTDDQATEYVRSTFGTSRIGDMRIRLTFGTDRVRVDGSAVVPTTIANVIGIKQVPVGGTAEALFGDTKIEIALVLDNTGSMSESGKLDTLKVAAHNFLNKMQGATNPSGLKVAIVPFDTDVNLGTLKTSWWVDPAQTAAWTTNPGTSGCIWDRSMPNDATDAAPEAGSSKTLYGADESRTRPCSLAPLTPLTNDFTLLHGRIDQMAASGNTNLTIGLVWGLHVLSPGEPVTTALPFGTRNLTKYMIMMTDGNNTQSRTSSDANVIDNRTRQVCREIKSAGIQVFTARIMDGNQSLLQDCATTPGMYYDVQNPAQLDPVFNSIYASIVGLRIAR